MESERKANLTTAQGQRNLMTGKAGECAVASQLFLRGLPITFAVVDMGVDLFAHNGCRIQVKCAHVLSTPKAIAKHGEGSYFFPMPKSKRRAVSDLKVRVIPKASFASVCDVVVFWGIEQNRFWVVPSAICDKVQAFVLGPNDRKRFSGSIEELRELSKLGYSHDEIAVQMNCCRWTITHALGKEIDFQEASAVSVARTCEGAWENILNFGEPAPVIEQVNMLNPELQQED